MRYFRYFLINILILTNSNVFSQNAETIQTTGKKTEEKQQETKDDLGQAVYKDSTRLMLESLPKKASIRSAILPGWGQLFNKGWGYVKAPIIWGGIGGLIASYSFAQKNYQETLTEVQDRLKNQDLRTNPKYQGVPTDWLIDAKDFYRRNRDLTILLSVGWHALNIIDAYVDAKFKRYDISNDLTFRINPTLLQDYDAVAYRPNIVLGVKATIQIK